ncbi:MAG: branched-chain amino acid ABC transporter permease [Betaproteobacteria bacterium]|nr:branched-chain amino acid ABC transporter permease [Betaproteobacteria bacterium]
MRGLSAWRDWMVWPLCAVLLALAPLLFGGSFALALLSQMGIAIVACLSFNLLFGQGGMLSFGHAVYAGLGGFVAMHALNAFSDGAGWLPVSLVPLCGGLGGLAFALVFAYPSTRRAGSSFAMITLGLGELVYALTTLLPAFFGGEAGITGNRVNGRVVGGLSFGPAIELYYLLALYTLVCALLMYWFTRTPLGQMLQAVRDNPQRVASLGYDPQRVRYLAMLMAGFFAGVSGGMAALHFEIVNAEAVGSARSAAYLVFTVLGGAASFAGPVLGGVLMVLCTVLLSAWTKAWLLYLGLGFVLVVVYAPGGLAGVLAQQLRLARSGRLLPLLPWYGALAACGLVALWGVALAIEMLYHQQLHAASGSAFTFLGLALDTATPASWLTALGLLLAGGLPGLWVYPRCAARYAQAHAAAGLHAQPAVARGVW